MCGVANEPAKALCNAAALRSPAGVDQSTGADAVSLIYVLLWCYVDPFTCNDYDEEEHEELKADLWRLSMPPPAPIRRSLLRPLRPFSLHAFPCAVADSSPVTSLACVMFRPSGLFWPFHAYRQRSSLAS